VSAQAGAGLGAGAAVRNPFYIPVRRRGGEALPLVEWARDVQRDAIWVLPLLHPCYPSIFRVPWLDPELHGTNATTGPCEGLHYALKNWHGLHLPLRAEEYMHLAMNLSIKHTQVCACIGQAILASVLCPISEVSYQAIVDLPSLQRWMHGAHSMMSLLQRMPAVTRAAMERTKMRVLVR
jgi:hypothetical protein